MAALTTDITAADGRPIIGLVDGEGPDNSGPGVWVFGQPTRLIEARTPAELEIACTAIDQASVSAHVVLLADYEIGAWFEPRLRIATEGHAWAPFQAWVFDKADWLHLNAFEDWLTQSLDSAGATKQPSGIAGVRAELGESEYAAAVASVQRSIAAGETYQINLTWRIDFTFFGSPIALYRKLRRSQPVKYGACLLLRDRVILSLSPELFLERRGDLLVAKPMKGTRARVDRNGAGLAEALRQSEKDRAENLMIVDLIRNDLGKIAETGSVQVDQLFRVEEYPTVYQMVSQVSAQAPDRSLYRTLKALFPCGSVTGAPKIRSMQIISSLERSSRGIYTGTIGHIKPGGDFSFNVAIRTIELTPDNRGRLHVGSGIVADSLPNSEYAECWAKARFLTELPCEFALLETLLHENGNLKRFEAHLKRLEKSAHFFGFTYNESAIRQTILSRLKAAKGRHRCRLTLNRDGGIDVQFEPLARLPDKLFVVLAAERTRSWDQLLQHKTTARNLYDDVLGSLQAYPTVFDALFFNERDELTEGARSNVFLLKNGSWFTPPLESGLLNGIMRREILYTRRVREQKLYHEDLVNADAVFLSNALRGLVRVSLKS